jgi:DNA polymerase III subunit gamma/tau
VLGTATSQTVLDVISSVMDHDPAHGLETIHKALDAGADPRSLARQIVEYLRGLMLIQMGNANQVEATADVKKQMQSHARSFSTSDVLRMMKAFNSAATDLRGGWQPSLSLELALAEVLDAPNEPLRPVAHPSSGPAHSTPQPSTAHRPEGNPAHNTPAPAREEKPASMPASEPPVMLDQGTEPAGEEIPSQPEEAPASRAPGKSALSAADVSKSWKHLASSLPKSQANLSALLNSVKMIDVQGKTLILGLASDVLVSKIDKPDQIEAIQKLVREQFGVDVNIRCVVTTAKGKIPPNVPQDGMVATAIQHGGQIVDM